jgi:hypothetical protein
LSEKKKKIEGKKTKELHACMPVVKFGACVYPPKTHPERKQRKKRSHPGNFSISSVMNETEEKGGGEFKIE